MAGSRPHGDRLGRRRRGRAGALGRIDHFAGPVPWPALARWGIGLALVHDLVLAPIACLVGLAVGRLLPWPAKGPVAAGLFVSATVSAVAWPALRGYGRLPGDPSALPGNYAPGPGHRPRCRVGGRRRGGGDTRRQRSSWANQRPSSLHTSLTVQPVAVARAWISSAATNDQSNQGP